MSGCCKERTLSDTSKITSLAVAAGTTSSAVLDANAGDPRNQTVSCQPSRRSAIRTAKQAPMPPCMAAHARAAGTSKFADGSASAAAFAARLRLKRLATLRGRQDLRE